MPILSTAKRVANRLLVQGGQVIANADEVPSMRRLATALKSAGIMPLTVFDIGVAYGTPWLYEAFSKARFHLIDPTKESLPYMERWATLLDAEIHRIALGSKETVASFKIRKEIGGSTLYDEVGVVDIVAEYDVPVRRFDDVFEEIRRPSLCKIDVQGAELDVLRGIGDRLSSIDVFIVEVSLIATLRGNAPVFYDIASWFDTGGFCLYDIVGLTRRPVDNALAQIDAVFVPKKSPLRSDARWSR